MIPAKGFEGRYVPLSFTRWLAVLMDDLQQGYDIVICIDSKGQNRHGPVGVGKTNFADLIAHSLNPDFDLKRDMVVRDDIAQAERVMEDRRPYKICWFDEWEWFAFLQWWQRPRVKALTPEFMSNRKEGRIWIFCIPVIWAAVWFFVDYRIQWRLCMKSRTEVDVFMRNRVPTRQDRSYNKWGAYKGTITEVPKVPDREWDRYEQVYFDHPRPCRRGICVSAEPGGRISG